MIKRNKPLIPDWLADTQPSQSLGGQLTYEPYPPKGRRKRWRFFFIFLVSIAVYLFFPAKHTFLVLGIDRAFENTAIGRSDTNILMAVHPLPGIVSVLSIPRDLWVTIPNYGENRINAAHYFGEGEQAGNGPQLALDTIQLNFNIQVDSYFRIQLEKFPEVVDAMGGVTLQLEQGMADYPPGTHTLNGAQALAFVRDRSGTDDFFRMAQGQVFLSAFIRTLLQPASWFRAPQILIAILKTIDTNVPIWQIPRLFVAALRAYIFDKFEFIIIQREMVIPWQTSAGAQVLLPDWPKIQPILKKEFGD